MATGRSMQLTKQVGEYLVASELARRGLLAATFSGNVPDFDILAADSEGSTMHIQVKAIRGGAWQFSATDFVEVEFEGQKQVLGKRVSPRITGVMCVLVLIQSYGKDRFFVCSWEQLRDTAVSNYDAWLAQHNYVRPHKYDSLHCSLKPDELPHDFENNWELISKKLQQSVVPASAG